MSLIEESILNSSNSYLLIALFLLLKNIISIFFYIMIIYNTSIKNIFIYNILIN